MRSAGDKVGRLTLLAYTPGSRAVTPRTFARWDARCDCGNLCNVSAGELGRSINSCGCIRREIATRLKLSHEKCGTSIYYRWAAMVGRCTNPKHKRYADYGGRGIFVCAAWLSFDSFYADMGDAPAGLTLDRIDNDNGYEPSNCRWATYKEQNNNKRAAA